MLLGILCIYWQGGQRSRSQWQEITCQINNNNTRSYYLQTGHCWLVMLSRWPKSCPMYNYRTTWPNSMNHCCQDETCLIGNYESSLLFLSSNFKWHLDIPFKQTLIVKWLIKCHFGLCIFCSLFHVQRVVQGAYTVCQICLRLSAWHTWLDQIWWRCSLILTAFILLLWKDLIKSRH